MTDRLEQLQHLYESGNPVAAWEALTLVLSRDPAGLPDWVAEYLLTAAERILQIDPDPKSVAGAVLDALELSGTGGPSLVRQYQTARRRAAALDDMAEQIAQGTSPDMAAATAGARHGYSETSLMTYWRQTRREKTPEEPSRTGTADHGKN